MRRRVPVPEIVAASAAIYDFAPVRQEDVSSVAAFLATHPDWAGERHGVVASSLATKLAVEPRGWIARLEGRVVASCTLTRKPLIWDGRAVDGAEIGDTYTSHAHQRRGLFADLVQRSTAGGFERGYPVVYGTPNPQSRAGYLAKCGYREWPQAVVSLVCPVIAHRPLAALWRAAAARTRPMDDFRFWVAHEPRWRGFAQGLGLAVDRCSDYLEWRYRAIDGSFRVFAVADGTAPAYLVTRTFRQGASVRTVIADLWAARTRDRMALLARALGEALDAGARWLTMWAPARSAPAVQAMTVGFVPRGRVSVIYRSLQAPARSRLYFMIGDSDNV